MSNYKSIHSLGILQASQQAKDYGKFFASFLLENVSYHGFVSSIKKYCSSLALLDGDKIALCDRDCRDEDGDMVNVCQADFFVAFLEMLLTAKEVKDHDYKKIFIQAQRNEVDSACPCKMRRGKFGL